MLKTDLSNGAGIAGFTVLILVMRALVDRGVLTGSGCVDLLDEGLMQLETRRAGLPARDRPAWDAARLILEETLPRPTPPHRPWGKAPRLEGCTSEWWYGRRRAASGALRVDTGRRRWHPRRMDEPRPIVAIAWYSREDWPRWQTLEARNAAVPYDGWLQRAEGVAQQLEAQGQRVVRVTLDPDEAVAWCRERARDVDGKAMAELASLKISAKDHN